MGRKSDDDARDFDAAVEQKSRGIRDPVAKLRYIRESMERRKAVDEVAERVPWSFARRQLYRFSTGARAHRLIVQGASRAGDGRRALVASRALVAVAAVAVSLAAAGVGWRAARPEGPPVMAAPEAAAVNIPPATLAPAPREAEPPLAARGIAPAAVWLVEKGAGYEQYSNGLRIDTTHATDGTPRSYRVFNARGLQPEVLTRPIGLLFHTSESDVWPLEASFNENLKGSSQNLVRYVRKNRLYHYVIDRFGRVYRIVGEEYKANHAGNSIWEDEGRIVLNLNHAFIGISFETRWEGGRALPITRAQFSAGRDLADHLRQKWSIAPGMCVTHGLTSVNPAKHYIGHHVDWARGFPFDAYGLPDQYARPLPSIALFGFGYDGDLLSLMGDLWPGVAEAEKGLAKEAAQLGESVDQLREEKRARYDQWLAEQVKDEQARLGSAPRMVTRATRER